MGIVLFLQRGVVVVTMSRLICGLWCLGVVLVCRAEEFTLDIPTMPSSKNVLVEKDSRRYMQVRDDLLSLLAAVMELSVGYIERLADVLVRHDLGLQNEVASLIRQLSHLQSDVCGIVHKIADGMHGMSCKRLKIVEKKFLPIQRVLEESRNAFDEKVLEKTGKNGENVKRKIKEDIELLSLKLRNNYIEAV